jgi:hypothetical protein
VAQRGQVTLEDLLLLEAVGEKEYERIMRKRLRKAKPASINKDDRDPRKPNQK